MISQLRRFERLAREAHKLTEARQLPVGGLHPFDERNIHPKLQQLVRNLFDDGHFAHAALDAFIFLDTLVQRHSKRPEFGKKLMMLVLSENAPLIQLADIKTSSGLSEQEGLKFIFAGVVLAIRNPRAHGIGIKDSPDLCLDHLSIASFLIRKLEEAGYR